MSVTTTACHEVQRELGTQAPDDVRIYLLLYVYTIIQTAQAGEGMSHRFLQIPQEYTWKDIYATKFVLREKPKISHILLFLKNCKVLKTLPIYSIL